MSAPTVVILSAARTPWGSLLGSLSDVSALDLAHTASAEALGQSGLSPGDIDRVVMGNLFAHGCEGNPAGALLRRLDPKARSIPITVRAGCASGLAAAALAIEAIGSAAAHAILAGGFESVSQAPHLALGLRRGLRLGSGTLLDAARQDGPVGITALRREASSPRSSIPSRGHGSDGIVAVSAPAPGGGTRVQVTADDESFSPGAPAEAPRPPLADGAAAFVVASEEWARRRGLAPLCRISVASDPLAAAPGAAWIAADLPEAAERALRDAAGSRGDSAQPAWAPEGIPGHAPGADGARLIVTLAHAAKERGAAGIALAGDATGAILGVRLQR